MKIIWQIYNNITNFKIKFILLYLISIFLVFDFILFTLLLIYIKKCDILFKIYIIYL